MALVAPAGTPKAVVDRLNAETRAALGSKEFQEAMAKIGTNILGSTPEQAAQFFRTELDKHTELARSGGAKMD